MPSKLTGPARILAGLLWLAALSGTAPAKDVPPSADALIASKPELAALQQQVIEREAMLELYGALGDDRLGRRYEALVPPSAQGGGSYRLGTDHALDRLWAACAPPSCDFVKSAAAEMTRRLALLDEVLRLRPALPLPEPQLRARLCTLSPCAFAAVRAGEAEGRPVFVARVDATDEPGREYAHQYLARLSFEADHSVRLVQLLSNQDSGCHNVPNCIWQDAAGVFTFDPASGLVSGRFEYQRNTWEYALRVVPQWQPVRYKEAHWGLETPGDADTAWSDGRSADWDSGYVSGIRVEGECAPPFSGGGGDLQGYVIPFSGRPLIDWKHEVPARSLAIKVPRAGEDPPGGFVLPALAAVDSAVSMRVSALDLNTLWVEVHDPGIRVEPASWLARSHLELWNWLPPVLADGGGECIELPWLGKGASAIPPEQVARRANRPQQWGIDLDGKGIHAGFGEPPPGALAVEAYRVDGSTVRMRIVLPPAGGAAKGSKGRRIALAYSVSDGRRQVGLLATSGYRHANPAGFTWIGEPDPF